MEETQSTIKDSEEKSHEQFYGFVKSSDEEISENTDVVMEQNAMDEDTDKNQYAAKTDEENPRSFELELRAKNLPPNKQKDDDFKSAYVSIPSTGGLKITI